uniref:Uncharacterized protein n=1 Tax=Periophthalmus magnuspinnatus TaxID=409849 RepID=A0A3B4B5B4_9GOBI
MAVREDSAESSAVRRRRVDPSGTGHTETSTGDSERRDGTEDSGGAGTEDKKLRSLQPGTYWLTRIVLLRAVAFIYCEQN